jgi:hypothetical protein
MQIAPDLATPVAPPPDFLAPTPVDGGQAAPQAEAAQ